MTGEEISLLSIHNNRHPMSKRGGVPKRSPYRCHRSGGTVLFAPAVWLAGRGIDPTRCRVFNI